MDDQGVGGELAMEIVAVIGFYVAVFVMILVLRRAARSDVSRWSRHSR
jgi:hypothetical protein